MYIIQKQKQTDILFSLNVFCLFGARTSLTMATWAFLTFLLFLSVLDGLSTFWQLLYVRWADENVCLEHPFSYQIWFWQLGGDWKGITQWEAKRLNATTDCCMARGQHRWFDCHNWATEMMELLWSQKVNEGTDSYAKLNTDWFFIIFLPQQKLHGLELHFWQYNQVYVLS